MTHLRWHTYRCVEALCSVVEDILYLGFLSTFLALRDDRIVYIFFLAGGIALFTCIQNVLYHNTIKQQLKSQPYLYSCHDCFLLHKLLKLIFGTLWPMKRAHSLVLWLGFLPFKIFRYQLNLRIKQDKSWVIIYILEDYLQYKKC